MRGGGKGGSGGEGSDAQWVATVKSTLSFHKRGTSEHSEQCGVNE